MTTQTNRLAAASSAYLRSAAHQPIDWHEFGQAAFDLARELDRPVLLDIGAVWCHWCHVIDRESYEDAEIADIINQHYVAIKVDRDQRPDIDARYQQVIASMTGQGGWPLTGFLTHDGRVIYGGTYFPPQSMKSLLLRVKDVYQEKKAEIFAPEALMQAFTAPPQPRQVNGEARHAPLERMAYEHILLSAQNAFDPTHGGFGKQPKFPHFSILGLMIAQVHESPHESQSGPYREIIVKTLEEMARGGIYDQVAGGFHRYSVDAYWHVPHFEKMLYDNAEALQVYAQAYRLTEKPLFKEIALGIIRWVSAQLSDPERGGFYASQDADIDLEDDGDHFTWTVEEVRAALSPEETEFILRYYDLTAQGDMHERPGRNVLRVPMPLEAFASQQGLSLEAAQSRLASAQTKLQEVRRQRPTPFVDKTLYTHWNGMMIAATLEAANLLGLPEAEAFALKSLARLTQDFYQPGGGVLHTDGVAGLLEDVAWFAHAHLKAYETTGEAQHLTVSQDMVAFALDRLEDASQGGFYDIPPSDDALGLLKIRRKPVEDSPSSSANSVMIQVLLRLEAITGEARYRERAEAALQAFAPYYEQYGLFVGALGLALRQFLHPPLKIEVVGSPASPLAEAARRIFAPGKVLCYSDASGTPELRLCVGTRCLPPVQSVEALEALVPKGTPVFSAISI